MGADLLRQIAEFRVAGDFIGFEWDTLRQELARALNLWTVLGSVHRLTPPHRPHNSLYVISDRGEIVTRYDERMLSETKISYMYAPGSASLTFDVDGVRFGCLLGIEVHFPELFSEYERLSVDCVLFSTTGGAAGDEPIFATEAQGLAAANSYWVSFSVPARHAAIAPSGLIGPAGQWLARGPRDGTPSVVVADLDDTAEDVEIAVFRARPWRRTARTDRYTRHVVHDPRSTNRRLF